MATTTMQAQSMDLKAVLAMIWATIATLGAAALAVLGITLIVGMVGNLQGLTGIITGALAIAVGALILRRYVLIWQGILRDRDYKTAHAAMRQDIVQLLLISVLLTVLFPVIWILSMSFDPRDFSRPNGLTIIPPGATLRSYAKILTQPSPNPVSFFQLLLNSLLVSGGTAALAVAVGTSAAYAFSRMDFPGRRIGMLGFVLVLMIPPGGTLAPLFVLLNSVKLRTTLWGLAIAYTSTALPFAIWNMKGFIDSLPFELEEAAMIDGCTRFQSFIRIVLPLATPGMAVTAMWGFLTGWSEFILAWTFLTEPTRFTLPMVLRGMVGQYASGTPWSEFAAMSIVMSIPPVLIFFFLQRYLVAGLAVGGVKG